jgi:hypothetical protein
LPSWRTCPKANARRNVPSAEGAGIKPPSNRRVLPARRISQSSTLSAPSSAALAGCAAGGQAGSDQAAGWSKSITQTTCSDWTNSMAPSDRSAMAASKLQAVECGGQHVAGSASDLATAITAMCAVPKNGSSNVNDNASIILTAEVTGNMSIQTAGASLAGLATRLKLNRGSRKPRTDAPRAVPAAAGA